MSKPTSISRTSLGLIVLLGAGLAAGAAWPPDLARTRAALRPTASVTVSLDAEIYLRRLADSGATRAALQDTLRAVLQEHFGYVDWVSDTGAVHQVHVSIEQDILGSKPSFLVVSLSDWPADSTVREVFEENIRINDRLDWSVDSVAASWAGRLREIARDRGVALQQEVMVDMPLAVSPELVQFEAVIRVPIDTLRAASRPHPEFKLRVQVTDSLPIVSVDTGFFLLRPCRADTQGQVYACKIHQVDLSGDVTLDASEVSAELGQPDIVLEPLTAHLWLYHPNQDPR